MTFTFLIILLVGFGLLGFIVQNKLKSKFKDYSKIPTQSGLTGREVAEKMLRDNHIHDVQVISVPGRLTDHYNPKNRTVNLSPDVYNGRSIAAAAVAAHECGHAVQHATSYSWLTMRSNMVPIVNISSQLMQVLLFMMIIGASVFSLGYDVMMYVFLGAQAVITAFSLVTLPVEYDASNRALVWLEDAHITSPDSHEKAKEALTWAARTYLVSALASVATLIYYIMLFASRD